MSEGLDSTDAETTDSTTSTAAPPAFRANILAMPKTDLEDLLVSWGQPKYRAKQILQAATENGKSFEEMQTLPAALRDKLAEHCQVNHSDTHTTRIWHQSH